MKTQTSKTVPSAFMFIELLFVIGAIAFIVLVIVPNMTRNKVRSVSVRCVNNLKQIGPSFRHVANEK